MQLEEERVTTVYVIVLSALDCVILALDAVFLCVILPNLIIVNVVLEACKYLDWYLASNHIAWQPSEQKRGEQSLSVCQDK